MRRRLYLRWASFWLWGWPSRVLWRWEPYRNWTGRMVWTVLARDPTFDADMRESLADLAAGRAYAMVDREFIPKDTWRPDDPKQPDGWRHDGEKWVRA